MIISITRKKLTTCGYNTWQHSMMHNAGRENNPHNSLRSNNNDFSHYRNQDSNQNNYLNLNPNPNPNPNHNIPQNQNLNLNLNQNLNLHQNLNQHQRQVDITYVRFRCTMHGSSIDLRVIKSPNLSFHFYLRLPQHTFDDTTGNVTLSIIVII